MTVLSEDDAKLLIRRRLHVSRETMEALDRYAMLVKQWSSAINLVSRADRDRIWSRHIADSLGLSEMIEPEMRWLDIGSGAGFPALPLAVLAKDRGLGVKLCVVEADLRKSAFLRSARRELDLDFDVKSERIEDLDVADFAAEVITARALATVDKLLELVENLVEPYTQLLFLKGHSVPSELTIAAKKWHMSFEIREHPLFVEGRILRIQGFGRAQSSRSSNSAGG